MLCAETSEGSAAADETVIARAEDDPGTTWATERSTSDEALAAQDADPAWEAIHARTGALVEVRAHSSHP